MVKAVKVFITPVPEASYSDTVKINPIGNKEGKYSPGAKLLPDGKWYENTFSQIDNFCFLSICLLRNFCKANSLVIFCIFAYYLKLYDRVGGLT